MLLRPFLVFSAFCFLTACQNYKVVAVKDFRVFADTKDPVLKHSIEVLTARYNKEMGSQALTLVRTAGEANSKISFKSGLHDDGHKLGLGQWITSRSEKSTLTIEGETNTSTVAYAMDVEFDLENFQTKSAFIDQSTSDQAQHLYHLFCHEIGHGLQMDHSTDIKSVMFPTIPDRPTRFIDYTAYFNQARSFLSAH